MDVLKIFKTSKKQKLVLRIFIGDTRKSAIAAKDNNRYNILYPRDVGKSSPPELYIMNHVHNTKINKRIL